MLNWLHKIWQLATRFLLSRLNGSTVGVRAIVVNEKKQILLVKHTYIKDWHFPGGGLKKRETLPQAIIRELYEEAGIITTKVKLLQIYLHEINGVADYPALYWVDEFTQVPMRSVEIAETQWFDLQKLPADLSPATHRRIQEYFFQASRGDHW